MAARFSSVSIASRWRSGLRERSDGASSCCSSWDSRSADVLNTRRLRPWTPKRASSCGDAHDLAVRVVVEPRLARAAGPPCARLAIRPYSSSSATSCARRARGLEHLLERRQLARGRARRRRRGAAPSARLAAGASVADLVLRAPARELLADDPQRQELVALQAQDRPQPRRRRRARRAGTRPAVRRGVTSFWSSR